MFLTPGEPPLQKRRRPVDCNHYPLCEHLKTLVSEIPPDLFVTKTIVLQKEAERLCAQCDDFEPRETPENS